MTPLREAVLAKLRRGRHVLEELLRGEDWESDAIEWQKGYLKALEEVLELEGLSLRRAPRRTTFIPAGVVCLDGDRGGERGVGNILDLSAGGCRLGSRLALREGELLQISFALPNAVSSLVLEGYVRRAQEVDGESRIGVEFKDPSPAAIEVLQAFCAPEAPAGRP